MLTCGAQKLRDISSILIRDISGPLLETFHSRYLRIPDSTLVLVSGIDMVLLLNTQTNIITTALVYSPNWAGIGAATACVSIRLRAVVLSVFGSLRDCPRAILYAAAVF